MYMIHLTLVPYTKQSIAWPRIHLNWQIKSGTRIIPDLLDYLCVLFINPVYAGGYRGYDMAALMDTNLPLTLGSVATLQTAPA